MAFRLVDKEDENKPAAPVAYLSTLIAGLKTIDSTRTTQAEIARWLEKRQKEAASGFSPLLLNGSSETQLFFATSAWEALITQTQQLEDEALRQLVIFLQAVVDRRAARGDLWPTGRLELGIAYATLNDWENAQRMLDMVIKICESGGHFTMLTSAA